MKVSLVGCISTAKESVPAHHTLGGGHRSQEFTRCRNVNCFNGWGAVLIPGDSRRSHKECLTDCKAKSECEGISVMYGKSEEQCVLIRKVRIEQCKTGAPGTDIWLKNSNKSHSACPRHTHPKHVPTVEPIGDFKCVANTNCYAGHGAKPVPGSYYHALARDECMKMCSHTAACEGVVVPSSPQWQCWLLKEVKLKNCTKGAGFSFCSNRDASALSLVDQSQAWSGAMPTNGSAFVWWSVFSKWSLMCTAILLALYLWRRRRSEETSSGELTSGSVFERELTLDSILEQLAMGARAPRAARDSMRALSMTGDDEETKEIDM